MLGLVGQELGTLKNVGSDVQSQISVTIINILAFCVAPQSSRGRIGRRGSKAAHEAAAPAAASSTSERRPGWRRSTVWDVDGEGRLHVAANKYSQHEHKMMKFLAFIFLSVAGALKVSTYVHFVFKTI